MKSGGLNKKQRISEEVEEGSGNVFADIGLPNPEVLLVKATLMHHIHVLITERKLTQRKAAQLLRIDQPKVSALIRGRMEGFSIERLCRFLKLLDQEVEIIVRPKKLAKDMARRQSMAG